MLLPQSKTIVLLKYQWRPTFTSQKIRKVVCINQNFQQTIWHYHGGCQVGRVVDKGYRVPAIDSLRVIDGSTFYHTPFANPQATVMMIGRQVHGAKDSA
ncbi:unnamed protein product [Prunus armeniaca]